MTKIQTYFPDPDDSDIVFNIPSAGNGSPKTAEGYQTLADDEATDSDEAPDDVSFSTSKKEALSVLEAEEHIKRSSKEEQKKRRQKKAIVMKEQKEEKLKRLQALASKRLPDELIDTVSAQPVVVTPVSKKIKSHKVPSSHKRFEDEHYIPITTGDVPTPDFSVAILQSKKWKNKFSKPGHSQAKDFRQRMLNNRSIKREPTNAITQARMKLASAGKSALVGS